MKTLCQTLIVALGLSTGTAAPVAAQSGDFVQRLMMLLNDAGRSGAAYRGGYDDDDDGGYRAGYDDDDDDGYDGGYDDDDDDGYDDDDDDGYSGGRDDDDDDGGNDDDD